MRTHRLKGFSVIQNVRFYDIALDLKDLNLRDNFERFFMRP